MKRPAPLSLVYPVRCECIWHAFELSRTFKYLDNISSFCFCFSSSSNLICSKKIIRCSSVILANFFFNFLSAISNVVVARHCVSKQNKYPLLALISLYFQIKHPSAKEVEANNVVERVLLFTRSLCSQLFNLNHESLVWLLNLTLFETTLVCARKTQRNGEKEDWNCWLWVHR